MISPQYSMLIQWSDEDHAYVVSFPEFNRGPMTHGTTYEEAAQNGREVLEMLVEHYVEQGITLPEPAAVFEPAPHK